MPGTLNLTLTAAVAGGMQLRNSSENRFVSAAFMRPRIADSGNKCGPSMRAFTATAAAPASLYEVLRIKQNASATEIKSAYRSLAKVYHPDSAVRQPEFDDRDFIEIHDAYETLSDPAARAIYDLSLTMAAAHGGRGSRPLVTPNGAAGFYRTTRRWETDQCW